MKRSTSLRAALLILTAVAGTAACSGEEPPPRADASDRCASEQAPSVVAAAPGAPARATSAEHEAATKAPAPARDERAEAFRFTTARFEPADLEAIGLELAPATRATEAADLLTPFAERLGRVAVDRCRDGDRPACGRLLALYATGVLVPEDASAAAALRDALVSAWSTACRGGDDEACVVVLGLPSTLDVADRPALGRHVCARHRGLGCEVLAAVADAPATREALRVQAAGLYVDACDEGDVGACLRLAGMYRRGEVAHSKRPRARRKGLLEHVRELWRVRCDAGDAYACGELGISWLVGPKPRASAAREAFAHAIPPVRLPAP